MWMDPNEQSKWAYEQCKKDRRKINELKHLIVTSRWAYKFCKHIYNDSEVRERIIDSLYCYKFCICFRYSNEMASKITKEYKKKNKRAKQTLKKTRLKYLKRRK